MNLFIPTPRCCGAACPRISFLAARLPFHLHFATTTERRVTSRSFIENKILYLPVLILRYHSRVFISHPFTHWSPSSSRSSRASIKTVATDSFYGTTRDLPILTHSLVPDPILLSFEILDLTTERRATSCFFIKTEITDLPDLILRYHSGLSISHPFIHWSPALSLAIRDLITDLKDARQAALLSRLW